MAEKILIKLFIKHYLHLEMKWKSIGDIRKNATQVPIVSAETDCYYVQRVLKP